VTSEGGIVGEQDDFSRRKWKKATFCLICSIQSAL